MNISLVIITDGRNPDGLKRALKSAEPLVQETLIVLQGGFNRELIQELLGPNDFLYETTFKGNADIDRNFAYSQVGSKWVLALDDDEYIPPETQKFIARVIKSEAEVVWFDFRNLVDGVNIKDILGPDPHPRLWVNRQPPIIDWPAQAHTYPRINSPLQYFTTNPIVHDRKFADIKKRHEERGKVIGEQQLQVEKKFIEAVKRKLG